jgi:2-polyprenyl-3-methyl-5-hydroxy-6-metoxy-1,4-benzoquinol methylase
MMKSTPMHDAFNADLLRLIPTDIARAIEVGCSSGALAKAYREINPACEYVGIEIDPDYAEVASRHCTNVVVGNIEHLDDHALIKFGAPDCWIFGDVIEHLYDPWSILRRVRSLLAEDGSVVACIPNAQHWSMQARLNGGDLTYEDSGLMDRTHIRWFTRATIGALFHSCGFEIVEGGGRAFDEPQRSVALEAVRAMAAALGGDPELAASDATPLHWLVRAVPA